MSEESKHEATDAPPTLNALSPCLKKKTEKAENKQSRGVSFPSDDELVTGYLEPANPWEYSENVSRDDLVSMYKASCEKHGAQALPQLLKQLEGLDVDAVRCELLSLKGEPLSPLHCECLEEVLKRVQFKVVDLDGTALDDEAAASIFDMIEYYEAASHINISNNHNIAGMGWKACANMIKKMRCLSELEARGVLFTEQYMPVLSRSLRLSSNLEVLRLDNCNLSGRLLIILAAALKLNTGLRELYLADNNLSVSDAMQLGALLRSNNTLQLLDISNNCVQDAGVGHILDGLTEQAGGGLGVLVLWNNHLTRNSSTHFARAVARSESLEVLNMGQNMLTNECLHVMKDALQKNRRLLRLGMQATHLSCEGAVALAECIADNPVIQRIDLRENNIKVAGLFALCHSMKVNNSVTQLDLDDAPKKKLETAAVLEQYRALVEEIRQYSKRNEELMREEEDTIDECDALERRGRLSSTFTRKISLTCETLLRQLEQPSSGYLTPGGPRRSGGRLRSPEPSPSPSPVPSPVPPSSPRSRFHVSRVVDASSPAVQPSLSSSPTRFFPTSSVSRFRVTVVDPPPVMQRVAPEISIQTDSTPSPEQAKPVFLAPQDLAVETASQEQVSDSSNDVCVTVLRDKATNKVVVSDRVSLVSQDSTEDTADLEVRQILSNAASDVCGKNKASAAGGSQSDPGWLLDDQPCEGDPCASATPNGSAFHHESTDQACRSSSTLPPHRCQSQNAKKLSWIMSEPQGGQEPKISSNIEKLLSLFRPNFFGKSATSRETTAPVQNMDIVDSSSSVKSEVSSPSETGASSAEKISFSHTGMNQVVSITSSHAGSLEDSDSSESKIVTDAKEVRGSCLGILSPDSLNNNSDKRDLSLVSRSFESEDENFNITKDSAAVVLAKQSELCDVRGEEDRDAGSGIVRDSSGSALSTSQPLPRSDGAQAGQELDGGGSAGSLPRTSDTCPAAPCGNRMDVDVLTNMFACWKVADEAAASSTNLVIRSGVAKSSTPVVVQMLADNESESSSLMVLQKEPTQRRDLVSPTIPSLRETTSPVFSPSDSTFLTS
ncbi:protein phosphatase 1 regulatory subunit 37 isoform X2 [Bacillus rossius redtenbacheri]|uniref:protein phosphatase 1 regulatory subunit 37 isoform X2 n=1 Tax=Bacillus rossius redtenbacheri TaxID=93214 RepID=UPI002FDD83A5